MTTGHIIYEFDEALFQALSELYEKIPETSKSAFNDPAFIRLCIENLCLKKKPFAILMMDNRVLIGACFFRNERMRFAGKYGSFIVPASYGVSDFTDFIVQPKYRKEFICFLVSKLLSLREYSILPNLLEQDSQIICDSSFRLGKFCTSANPYVMGEEMIFDKLRKKKSLMRHYNWFCRNGELVVKHHAGEINEAVVDNFASLHLERWAFEGHSSAFGKTEIRKFYEQLFSKQFSSNFVKPVLTEILFNNKVIAMHIGLKWANRFLYQIPVMNIEYIDRSPGEVLLVALLDYSKRNDVNILDLGFGNENYKKRFATAAWRYETFVLTPSLLRAWDYKVRSKARTLLSIQDIRQIYSVTREKLAHLVPGKVSFYCHKTGQSQPNGIVEMGFSDYVRYSRTQQVLPYALTRKIFERFTNGWRLLALRPDGMFVTFGWVVNSQQLYVAELGRKVQSSNSTVCWIVDCVTLPEFRNRGYYSSFLKKVISHVNSDYCIIYSDNNNVASRKGIARAGFEPIASIRKGFGLYSIKQRTVTELDLFFGK